MTASKSQWKPYHNVMHEDYVLRLVSQFAQFLLQILGLTKKGQYQAALEAINQAFKQLLDLDADRIDTLSENELITALSFGRTASEGRDRCIFLVTLLDKRGAIYASQNRLDDCYAFYLKALNLLLEVLLDNEEIELPGYAPTVENLIAALKGNALPTATHVMLLRYFEKIGAYARAEDTLFEMLTTEPENDDVVDMGVAFYQRLQQQSDGVLMAGNLPRDEVEASLAELLALRRAGTTSA